MFHCVSSFEFEKINFMKNKKPVLVCLSDSLTKKELLRLEGMDRFRLIATQDGDRDWLEKHLPQADAYMASLRVQLDAALIETATRLRVVGTNTTGTDHLDLKALKRRGIEVLSLKNDIDFLRKVTPTAELAFGLLLACARRIRECSESSRQGYWARHQMAGSLLYGKTIGIIGLGRLGTMVAGYAGAFHMRVIATDPGTHEFPDFVKRVSLEQLLSEADFISIHVHLNDETRNLLGAGEFSKMKKGAILINTSRGGLIDEKALLKAMMNGTVAAAGLDVIDGEWLEDKYNHPLIAYSRSNPNLLITPHVGGTCPESTRASLGHTLSKLAAFFSGVQQAPRTAIKSSAKKRD